MSKSIKYYFLDRKIELLVEEDGFEIKFLTIKKINKI